MTVQRRDFSKIRKGRRADLGDTCWKSSWEANTARYLNFRLSQGDVLRWEYEPKTFPFPGITRGAVCYCPDFHVFQADGTTEWWEVKGYETSRDRTKWKRFRKFYPEETLVVIGRDGYKNLVELYGGLPHWEK